MAEEVYAGQGCSGRWRIATGYLMKAATLRKVLVYIVFLVITVFCGLLSRSGVFALPGVVRVYGGDVLWGLMVFWCFCIARPCWAGWKAGLGASVFSFGIEFSQFYHAAWIDSIRDTRIGGLVLGYGFKYSDLACYSVGIAFGVVIVQLLLTVMLSKYISSK